MEFNDVITTVDILDCIGVKARLRVSFSIGIPIIALTCAYGGSGDIDLIIL